VNLGQDGIKNLGDPMVEFDEYEIKTDRLSSVRQLEFDYERASLMGSMSNIIENGGISMANSIKFAGAGKIKSGVGAFSAASSYSMAKANHEAKSRESVTKSFEIGKEICYNFPKREVEVKLKHVKLTSAILRKIRTMYDLLKSNGNEDSTARVKSLIVRLFHNYGSHVYLTATLGGTFILQGKMEVKDEAQLSSSETALSEQLKDSKSLAGGFFGGLFGLSAGGAVQQGRDQLNGDGHVSNSQSFSSVKNLDIRMIGGQDTSRNLELWKLSLGYSSNLKVIDRTNEKSVWDIVESNHGRGIYKRD
jgi:hypothetical protein